MKMLFVTSSGTEVSPRVHAMRSSFAVRGRSLSAGTSSTVSLRVMEFSDGTPYVLRWLLVSTVPPTSILAPTGATLRHVSVSGTGV